MGTMTGERPFSVLLRAARLAAGMTQEDLAVRSGMSVRAISDLERDRTRRPYFRSVRLLAEALGAPDPVRAELLDAAHRAQQRGDRQRTTTSEDNGTANVTQVSPAAEPVTPRQLPAAVRHFTGRRSELEVLADLAQETTGAGDRVVISTIEGTAGIGKTTLAVHFAHQVANRFGDGQLYVNLRGFDPRQRPTTPPEALTHLLRALRVESRRIPADLDDRAAMYRSLLAGKQVLIVLDNAATAEQVRPLLPGCLGCLVIVTSRNRLSGLVARDGAHRIILDSLADAEALALLSSIAGPARIAADPDAGAQLCRLCGNLPLAVRIAAERVVARPHVALADLVANLADEHHSLDVLTAVDDESTAMRAVFSWSYEPLRTETRGLFRCLGLVPGPDVTPDAAAALTGTTATQASRQLDVLAAAHLIEEHAAGRYRMHDLLRLYARERADAEDAGQQRVDVLRRLLEWYLWTAEAAVRSAYPELNPLSGRTDGAAMPCTGNAATRCTDDAATRCTAFVLRDDAAEWLEAERPNLVAAVLHGARHSPGPLACQLASALHGFFVVRMYSDDWLAVADAGLEAARGGGDRRGEAVMQRSLGIAHWRLGHYREAVEYSDNALAIARDRTWPDCEAAALHTLGNVYWELGQLDDATGSYAAALAVQRAIGNKKGEILLLANLGLVHREFGRLDEAVDHYLRALAIERRIRDPYTEAAIRVNLGNAYYMLGRFDDAHLNLRRALSAHIAAQARNGEAAAREFLARMHCDKGLHQLALEYAGRALTLARDVGDRRIQADALNTLGVTLAHLGRHREAADHHQRALDTALQTGNHRSKAEALLGLAAAHRHSCHWREARRHAGHALALARQHKFGLIEGQAHTALADIQLDVAKYDQTRDQCRRALAIHRTTGHRLGTARTLFTLGRAELATGAVDASSAHLRQALSIFTEIGVPDADQLRAFLSQHADDMTARPAPPSEGP